MNWGCGRCYAASYSAEPWGSSRDILPRRGHSDCVISKIRFSENQLCIWISFYKYPNDASISSASFNLRYNLRSRTENTYLRCGRSVLLLHSKFDHPPGNQNSWSCCPEDISRCAPLPSSQISQPGVLPSSFRSFALNFALGYQS